MPQLTDAEYKAGYKIIGSDVVDPNGKVARSDAPQQSSAPAALATAPPPAVPSGAPTTSTPAGTLAGSLPAPGESVGPLANLKLALQAALNEGGKARLESNMNAVAPLQDGMKPGTMGSLVNLVRGSVSQSVESIYNTASTAIDEQQKIELQKQQNALDIVQAMAKDGSLGSLPDEAILAMSKASGVDAGQLLAWRVATKSKNDLEIQKAQMDIELTKSQIKENLAQAAAAGRSNPSSPYSSTKPLTLAEMKKYNLPSTVNQGQYKLVRDYIQQATAGVSLTGDNRYTLWGNIADQLDQAGSDPQNPLSGLSAKDFDAVLWEKFHPEGLGGYTKYVQGQSKSNSNLSPAAKQFLGIP